MSRILILFWLSVLCFGFAKAQGVVVRVHGEVTLTHDTKTAIIQVGSKVQNGDKILTQGGERVLLRLDDGTSVQIGSYSQFVLLEDTFMIERQNVVMELQEGAMRFVTGKISKVAPERFRVKTTTSSIGIRGTDVAMFNKDGRTGVLYLGKGNGMYIENDHSKSELTHVGEGVVVKPYQTTPLPEYWSDTEAYDLLRSVAFENESIRPTIGFINQATFDGELKTLYRSFGDISRFDMFGSVMAKSASFHGIYFESQFDFLKNIQSSNVKDKNNVALRLASLNYSEDLFSFSLGRIDIKTPLTGVSSLGADFDVNSFGEWDEMRQAESWWWQFPIAFEGGKIIYRGSESLRLTFGYLSTMKHPQNSGFHSLGETMYVKDLFATNDNVPLYLLGGVWLWRKDTKAQGWVYHNSRFDTYYLQSDHIVSLNEHTVLFAWQYLQQHQNNQAKQKIDGSLFGTRLGYRYGGFELSVAFSKTFGAKNGAFGEILLPWEGSPAFTNSFALRNRNTSLSGKLLEIDGAYSAKTNAKQFAFGYDFGSIGRYGWQISSAWTAYDKTSASKETQTQDVVLHMDLSHYRDLHFDLRYAHALNIDGVLSNENVGQILIRYRF